MPPIHLGFCIPYELSSKLSSSQSWVTSILFWASMCLTSLDSTYQWNDAVFVFLCLAYVHWLLWMRMKEHRSAGASPTHPFISFGYILSNGIAGACGWFWFSVWRKLRGVFYNSTNVCSLPLCVGKAFSPYSCQYFSFCFLISFVLVMFILIGVRRHIVVFKLRYFDN